jgi:hypothetical protein
MGLEGAASDRTRRDSGGQTAENRGLAAVADGPDRPQADPECQSVSALVAGAIAALDRGNTAKARALLRDVAAPRATPAPSPWG